MSANKETVRLLEQRLAERDEAFAIIQKHHKIPIDYFALKAKVNLKKSWKCAFMLLSGACASLTFLLAQSSQIHAHAIYHR